MEMTIGKRIAALRREKGLKQDDLAQMLRIVVDSSDGDKVRIFVE